MTISFRWIMRKVSSPSMFFVAPFYQTLGWQNTDRFECCDDTPDRESRRSR